MSHQNSARCTPLGSPAIATPAESNASAIMLDIVFMMTPSLLLGRCSPQEMLGGRRTRLAETGPWLPEREGHATPRRRQLYKGKCVELGPATGLRGARSPASRSRPSSPRSSCTFRAPCLSSIGRCVPACRSRAGQGGLARAGGRFTVQLAVQRARPDAGPTGNGLATGGFRSPSSRLRESLVLGRVV